MALMRVWGERSKRIEAAVPPWVLEGPINGESFQIYVETELMPTLAPGDIVVMDNLGSHKNKAICQAIRAVGAKLLFLPKYSPDLNPIDPSTGAGFFANSGYEKYERT